MHESGVDDLAYLKRLAQAGRGKSAPVLPLMAVFGAAYGVSALLVYAEIVIGGVEGLERPGLINLLAGWSIVAAHLVFLGTLVWTGWRTVSSRGHGLSRSAVAIWSGALIAAITVFVAFRLYTRFEPPSDAIYTAYMLPPVLLTLWGVAWWTSALLSDRRWMFGVAIASFGAALAAAAIGNSLNLLLLAGLCLLGLALVPALWLMRTDRR